MKAHSCKNSPILISEVAESLRVELHCGRVFVSRECGFDLKISPRAKISAKIFKAGERSPELDLS